MLLLLKEAAGIVAVIAATLAVVRVRARISLLYLIILSSAVSFAALT